MGFDYNENFLSMMGYAVNCKIVHHDAYTATKLGMLILDHFENLI